MVTSSEQESLIWANYGFLGNPFDTGALSLFTHSPLSVGNAYLPRHTGGDFKASEQLDRFLRSEGGGAVVVEGAIGVGKTSLVNHHRHQWRKGQNSLFTPISEISAEKDWNKRQFLIDLLNSLARTFITSLEDSEIESNRLLMEIIATTGSYFTSKSGRSFGISVAGFGGQYGKNDSSSFHKGELSNPQLLDYLRQVVEEVKTRGHRGVLFHLDNFEILLDRRNSPSQEFLDDIRDVLQLRDCYFVLVARSGFFQRAITPLERVRSIFHSHPISVDVFSEEETIQILNKRYEVLAHRDRQYIKPAEDELVSHLYQLHEGRIRAVMNDIKAVILEFGSPNRVSTLDTAKAKEALKRIVEEKLGVLTPGERKFLKELPQGPFSNKDLVEASGKSKQYVNKLLNKLKEHHFVRDSEGAEEDHQYELAPEFLILRGGE